MIITIIHTSDSDYAFHVHPNERVKSVLNCVLCNEFHNAQHRKFRTHLSEW